MNKMFLKNLLLVGFLSYSSSMWAINCYYTLVKDSCWTNYNVSVNLIDLETNNVISTVTVPSGKSWTRQQFTCQPSQQLKFTAQFSPIFWESDKEKQFTGLKSLTLPATVTKGDSAWNISACFSADFAQIPLPPNVSGQCACDSSNIPPIPPQSSDTQ